MPVAAKAEMWDVPVGPGESFRWVFVTSETSEQAWGDIPIISYYNSVVNFVAAEADTPITGVAGISSIAEIDWTAIASTIRTDAIDNVGVSSSGIYTPVGTLVANGTSDLFDTTLETPIDITETGTTVNTLVWTGSSYDGTGMPYYALGGDTAMVGRSSATDVTWISCELVRTGTERPLYAISEELTVVPCPAALILGATGLLSSSVGLKRWSRKH